MYKRDKNSGSYIFVFFDHLQRFAALEITFRIVNNLEIAKSCPKNCLGAVIKK